MLPAHSNCPTLGEPWCGFIVLAKCLIIGLDFQPSFFEQMRVSLVDDASYRDKINLEQNLIPIYKISSLRLSLSRNGNELGQAIRKS